MDHSSAQKICAIKALIIPKDAAQSGCGSQRGPRV
jgi:hypothetical protein